MQKLTCSSCGKTWEREPKRGRPPKLCVACKDAPNNSVSDVEPAPDTSPTPKKHLSSRTCTTRGCKAKMRPSQLLDKWLFCGECKSMTAM